MNETFTKNLEALPPELRPVLSAAATGRDGAMYCATVSRSGIPVTGCTVDGRPRYFHSTYDPVREAERLAQSIRTESVVCLGFGSGHQIGPLLRRSDLVIVVEPDAHAIAHAMETVDLADELGDAGFHLIVGDSHPESSIPEIYRPAMHGSVSVVSLPGRIESAPETFALARESVRAALEAVSDDFATQARFGRLWFRNTIANIASLKIRIAAGVECPVYPDLAGKHVVVTAAGPSLDDWVRRPGAFGNAAIVATDTSLPVLAGYGVPCDAVVTVDCQPAGYLHYLSAQFPLIPVIADLAAPPAALRHQSRIGVLLSRHPLHQLLARLGARVPGYDSGGGNVTHAAVSVSIELGARSVTVVGADFRYPGGRSYARGTYVDTYLAAKSFRLEPQSSRLYRFVADRPGLYADADDRTTLRLPVLDRYRSSLADFARRTDIPVAVVEPGENPDQIGDPGARSSKPAPPAAPALPDDLLARLTDTLDSDMEVGRDTNGPWIAMLPLVAWHRRRAPDAEFSEVFEMALSDGREIVSLYLESGR